MLDFTSALYLGFEHSHDELPGWPRLSPGRPAALCEPAWARYLGQEVARLIGCEAGLVSASTLHLFWDLLGWFAETGMGVLLDGGAYPIAAWGAERAASKGAPLVRFRHSDPADLERQLAGRSSRRPVVVVDGFCPACGVVAPLRSLLECVRKFAGLLVLDDTQALGIFGSPASGHVFGVGGGGSLRWAGLDREDDVIVVSSLAKAFGAPLSVIAGPRRLIQEFERASETRVHCTPPSAAAIAAGLSALERNRMCGDALRNKLAALVGRVRQGLFAVPKSRGTFPFQVLAAANSARLHSALLRQGIRTVLRAGEGSAQIGILLTAKHTPCEVDILMNRLNRYLEEPWLV